MSMKLNHFILKCVPCIAACSLLNFANASEPISLNFNENNFGCFPSVTEAMQNALEAVNNYPDAATDDFITQLASYHSIKPEQIFISSGLSSILNISAEVFLGPGKKLIMAQPTFEVIKRYAQVRGTKVVEIPLRKDYSHDLPAMLSQIDASTKLIYICNPNNPTASITPRKEIEDFIQKLPEDVYVFIDEAYHHFAVGSQGYVSFIDKPIPNKNVIVGRSFSKSYGLAGMRLGYAVASPEIISTLHKFSAIDLVNNVVLRAGCAALKDEIGLSEMIQNFENARNEFYRQAKVRGLSCIPSYCNFIMVETNGRAVKDIIKHFKSHNIFIGREFPLMNSHVRVSLGRPEEMIKFWQVWDLLPQNK